MVHNCRTGSSVVRDASIGIVRDDGNDIGRVGSTYSGF
jgi:hypothetical protein